MSNDQNKIHEGDLFDTIIVDGVSFEIRYGYYADFERERWEPMPIFPDLKTNPVYTTDGELIVTQMQDICEKYKRRPKRTDDERCADCIFFTSENKKLIGICRNAERRRRNNK